ncbi:unnamed protein product, partial [Callosobruchus maculatus]
MCTFIYFSRNGSKGIRMFSDRMVIKRSLIFERSITANTCAELISVCCFNVSRYDELNHSKCAMSTFIYF